MPDMTTTQQDSVPSEEGNNQDYAEFPNAAGKPENGKRLEVEQDVQADQLADADAMLVAAVGKYASEQEAYDALVRLEPKMMISGQARFLLNGQKYRAGEVCEDLAQKEGGPDNHRHDRNTKLKTVKDETKYLFRGMEQACFAADLDPTEMGIDIMLNDPDIQDMGKSKTKPPQHQNDTQEQDRLFL